MDSRDLSPVPTAPAASPAGYGDARSWAEAEIAEWLAEADEEASAIIDRARAEALRCELAGHEELERLREEAVKVRMATAERVARRLNEARFEADQLLAEAGTQAESMVDSAREVVRDLLGGLAGLGGELPAGAAEQVGRAAARLEGLLAEGALAIPGRTGVLDLTGAVLLKGPGPATAQSVEAGVIPTPGTGRDSVVMDDTRARATSSSGTAGPATLVATAVQTVVDLRLAAPAAPGAPAASPPTQVLALPLRAGEGLRSLDDILPARPARSVAGAWWDRISRLVRRAA